MKEKIIILLLIIILIVVVLFLLFRKKIEITNIKSFHFSYSVSTAMYGNVSYDIKYENNNYVATIKPNGISEEEAIIINVDDEFVKEIEDYLKKNDIAKWDGFNKSDKNVLDGNSFSFFVRMEDDNSISATGYMKYPKKYSEAKGYFDGMFSKLLKEKEK